MKRLNQFLKISNLLLLVVLSVCLYGQNIDQNDELNLSFVTIITDQSSKIYLDDQYKGIGRWYGEITPGQHQIRIEKKGYEPVEEDFSIANGANLIVDVDGPDEKIEEPIPPINYEPHTFITLNGSLSFQPQFAMGLTFGYVKQYGVFASVMTGFGFKGFSTNITSDENGYVNGKYPDYTGNTSSSRLSIIVGGIASIKEKVFLRAGLGYGTRCVAYETKDGTWINHGAVSYSGIDMSFGVQAFFNKYTGSFDIVTTSFEAVELKFGIGITID